MDRDATTDNAAEHAADNAPDAEADHAADSPAPADDGAPADDSAADAGDDSAPRRRNRGAAAEWAYQTLFDRILSLELPPGMQLSEAQIARDLGLSRQPVRDAFARLSWMGFLTILPQRGTLVSEVSDSAIAQARFMRMAIEVEVARSAARQADKAGVAHLRSLLEAEAEVVAANDHMEFLHGDNLFHRAICDLAGAGFAWDEVQRYKAHVDRMRYALGKLPVIQRSHEDHIALARAIEIGDPALAAAEMRHHVGRVVRKQEDAARRNGPGYAE